MDFKNIFFNGQQGLALKELVECLLLNGFKAYLAGGAVRDYILGRPYKDLDIATDANVQQIQNLFIKTVPVGVQFGIVRVLIRGYEFEVAQFRCDGPYTDGRRPESIKFSSPEEDAQRRDFTINALFYDFETNQVIDFVDGINDLNNHLVKTVGDPEKRFSEDYLRILRALRFSCQLDFTIERETERAAEKLVSLLTKVSGERLCVEITKAIEANPEKAMMIFSKWNVPSSLFPHWNIEKVHNDNYYLKGRSEVGWLLSQWLINFQRSNCLESIEIISPEKWMYSTRYQSLINDMIHLFKLSNVDSKQLKIIGTVLSWPAIWPKLRMGYRASLAQSEEFKLCIEAAKQLKVWNEEMTQEVEGWLNKPLVKVLLLGRDTLKLSPDKRGLVLNECLYLQYEDKIHSRDDALRWLENKIQEGL